MSSAAQPGDIPEHSSETTTPIPSADLGSADFNRSTVHNLLQEPNSARAPEVIVEGGIEIFNKFHEDEGEEKPAQDKKKQPGKVKAKPQHPALSSFGIDVTELARNGELDPVIGRETEIERAIEILCRRSKSNPLFLGEAGVGKTALVEGIAQCIVSGAVPVGLENKRIFSLDLNGMIAGTKYRGQFEERIKAVLQECENDPDILLFIDELHVILGAGGAEGSMDAGNILKPALARGQIQCIGATTLKEYRKYIEKDAALSRRFQPVTVDPPTALQTVEILHGLRGKYEAHHRVRYTDEALATAAFESERYINDRFQPDKSIDLIDEAGARCRLSATKRPPELQARKAELVGLEKARDQAVVDDRYDEAITLAEQLKIQKAAYQAAEAEWKRISKDEVVTVTKDDILTVLSASTGVPVGNVKQNEREKLLSLEKTLGAKVIAQEEAIHSVAAAIRRARAGLKDPHRPIGSFFFVGQKGTGKTLLTKALAESLFNDADAVITIDMTEFMEKHTVSRLTGAPPGYTGYDEGGQLTERVRRKPFSIVYFDEPEKAHPDVFNLLLQILEEGRLTDSTGRVVDFRNTVIIFGSNLGAEGPQAAPFGFSAGTATARETNGYSALKDSCRAEIERFFRPEFINRLDDVVVFRPLNYGQMKSILEIELDRFTKRVAERGYSLVITEGAKELMLDKGYEPGQNARLLRRSMGQYLENPLVEAILRQEVVKTSPIRVVRKGDQLVFLQTEFPEGLGTPVPLGPATARVGRDQASS